MKYVVRLADISEQLLEVTDHITPELIGTSVFDADYFEAGGLASSRLRKLITYVSAIYVLLVAIRVTDDVDVKTSDIIHRHIEHTLSEVFYRDNELIYPLSDYDASIGELAHELYDSVHDAFLATESFDAMAFQEIVNYIMDIPNDIDLYDFTLIENYRFLIGMGEDRKIRGTLIIVG